MGKVVYTGHLKESDLLVKLLVTCLQFAYGFLPDFFQNKWQGVMHHVVNEHKWALGCCEHDMLDGTEEKKWLEPDSPPPPQKTDIVYNTWVVTHIILLCQLQVCIYFFINFPLYGSYHINLLCFFIVSIATKLGDATVSRLSALHPHRHFSFAPYLPPELT